jgi:hypothetical protein
MHKTQIRNVKEEKPLLGKDLEEESGISGKRNGAARLQPRKILTISLLKNLYQRCAYFAYPQRRF